MSNKLNKFLDPNISKEEEDKILEGILNKKLDNDLRARWEEKLKSKYGIEKEKTLTSKSKGSVRYLAVFLAAAASIALIIILQLFTPSSSDPYLLAQQYLEEQEILHPGATKGTTDENENRILAIQSFNNKDYQQAVSYFQNLENRSEEDAYYYGLALLLQEQYTDAIVQFEKSNEMGNMYRQELNWFISLSYLLNKQPDEASLALKQISNTDWHYDQAQRLLKQLNKK